MQETLNNAIFECPKSVEKSEFSPQVALGPLIQMYEEYLYWGSNIDLASSHRRLSHSPEFQNISKGGSSTPNLQNSVKDECAQTMFHSMESRGQETV